MIILFLQVVLWLGVCAIGGFSTLNCLLLFEVSLAFSSFLLSCIAVINHGEVCDLFSPTYIPLVWLVQRQLARIALLSVPCYLSWLGE